MKRLFADGVVLRPLQTADLPSIHAILRDPKVMRYVFSGAIESAAKRSRFIDREFTGEEKEHGLGTLCLREEHAVIGFAGVVPCEVPAHGNDLEFGFVLARLHQGKGYASRIGGRLIRYVVNDLGRRRVLALATPRNVGSCRVLQRHLGMELVDIGVRPGEWEPRWVYRYSLARMDLTRTHNPPGRITRCETGAMGHLPDCPRAVFALPFAPSTRRSGARIDLRRR